MVRSTLLVMDSNRLRWWWRMLLMSGGGGTVDFFMVEMVLQQSVILVDHGAGSTIKMEVVSP